jgi:hypothetical protein
MATFVVPPVYEAQIVGQGFDYAVIYASKVKIVATGRTEQSRPLRKSDKVNVATMSFGQLVEFVLGTK